ncbi:ribonucleotide reductase subunit alpha [Paucibacter sp. KBW04]|uniref:ribonucleotide reductase subunit alpha n=1 Tax=Paucibacter sp. KBW04 TaxID=2153361 RepID=UPI000F57C457|nr:ribonucleotide reductase subunit alpha [Paucibacter sp. KBW04]RQO53445.1 ribonucleotide reductase subunit alpha [Paucibacter sp. KBW04]
MRIESFNDLLVAARAQPQPQRLLLVFTQAELPDQPTAEQRQQFQAGRGGVLTPQICVDKTPDELSSFAALLAEAQSLGADWQIVFAAALSGSGGQAPTEAQTNAALQRMVEAIKQGQVGGLIPFDLAGQPLRLGEAAN